MKIKNIILLCIVTISTASCGIKPSQVESKNTSDNEVFPRTYPDVSTNNKS